MRIAFLVSEFPNLSETFILDQITGLIGCGHEVDIYADRRGNMAAVHPEVERLRLVERTCYWDVDPSLPRRAVKGAGLFARMAARGPGVALRAISRKRYGVPAASLVVLHAAARLRRPRAYDIIHCHFGPTGLVGTALRDLGLLSGKVLTSFYGYDLTSYPKRFGSEAFAPLFQRGDLLLPLCEIFRKHLVRLGGDPARMRVHHIGVDCRRFAFSERAAAHDGRVQLVTVARLAEKKGLPYSIRAVAALLKEFPGLRYVIVGNGPMRGELEALIAELGVGSAVQLAGPKHRDEIAAILAESHIFLAPSITARDGDQEGTPTVLMEAAAVGLPVVSTFHSGIPELVADGESGYLVPERDLAALTERIRELLRHPQRWAEMGRAGRRIVEEQFNIQRLNEDLEGIYAELLAAPAASRRVTQPASAS